MPDVADSSPPPSQSRPPIRDAEHDALYLAAASKKSLVSRATDRVLGLVVHTGQIWRDARSERSSSVPQAVRGTCDWWLNSKRSASHRRYRRRHERVIGMVMSVQFAFGLRKFGGMEYTGRVIGLSFSRELAPTLTAVIVGPHWRGHGSRSRGDDGDGAIDAIRALGADPFKKPVLPRLSRRSSSSNPRGFRAHRGFLRGELVTDLQFGIPAPVLLNSALEAVSMADFVSGMFKTPFFGAIIALVGCHFGLQTRGGTAGVAHATTRTWWSSRSPILIATSS